MTEKTQLFRDPQAHPSEVTRREGLGGAYPSYEGLCDWLADAEIVTLWHYYHDGKARLCKATYKKITIFWFSSSRGSL